jgi:hypothetical protein
MLVLCLYATYSNTWSRMRPAINRSTVCECFKRPLRHYPQHIMLFRLLEKRCTYTGACPPALADSSFQGYSWLAASSGDQSSSHIILQTEAIPVAETLLQTEKPHPLQTHWHWKPWWWLSWKQSVTRKSLSFWGQTRRHRWPRGLEGGQYLEFPVELTGPG